MDDKVRQGMIDTMVEALRMADEVQEKTRTLISTEAMAVHFYCDLMQAAYWEEREEVRLDGKASAGD